jgi:hypothetical protein
MVLAGPLVRHPIRPVHPTEKDKVALGPKASDASADPDAVPPAAEHLARCQGAVHGFHRSASVDAPEPWVSYLYQVPRQRDALLTAVDAHLVQSLALPQNAVQG